MATVKVRNLDGSSVGVTIPIDELRRDGVVVSGPGEEVEFSEEHYAFIDRVGEGEWKLKLTDQVQIGAGAPVPEPWDSASD